MMVLKHFFCFTLFLSLACTVVAGESANVKPTDGSGLVAHYYRDVQNWGGTWPDEGEISGNAKDWTFTKYSYTRVEPLINHLFIRSGWFSVRWKGTISIPDSRTDSEEGDLYTFYIWADDGCRLSINGKQLIDSWQPTWEESPEALRKVSVKLKPGEYPIVVEYFQGSSLKKKDKDPIKLYWECEAMNIPKKIIPASRFSHTKADFTAERGRKELKASTK